MLFFVTTRVMSFQRVVVNERAADAAANKILLGNREPEVRSRFCTLNIDPIREKIQ